LIPNGGTFAVAVTKPARQPHQRPMPKRAGMMIIEQATVEIVRQFEREILQTFRGETAEEQRDRVPMRVSTSCKANAHRVLR